MVLDRRGFMKFVAGAGAGIMVTPLPWKLLDDVSIWTQNWPWIPSNVKGETTYARAVSKMCPSNTAIKVRLVDGRPVRVLPVADHPLGGGVSSIAVAEVQMMHSPGRVSSPLLRAPDGGFRQIPWREAAKLLAEKFKEAKERTAFICGDDTGSTSEVMGALAALLGSNQVFIMPSEAQAASRAADLMGLTAQLGYDLEKSDYVLAIGANILESWGPVVRNRRIFAETHPHPAGGAKARAVFAYAGSVQNNSAAVAKPWLPIYPGTEAILALGIANMLIAQGRTVPATDFGAFKDFVAKYTPAEIAKLTGVDPKKLAAVVTALASAKAPLVIVGSEFGQGAGAAPIMAGVAVNALLGNINRDGGLTLLPEAPVVLKGAQPRRELYKRDLAAWLAGKNLPNLLILHEANPAYALPNPAGVREVLKNIRFKVSFSTFMDETARDCDLVLPIGMGIERVDDVYTPYGCGEALYCATGMAAEPAEDVRNTPNYLIYAAKLMGMDLGVPMYQDLLKAKAKALGANFDLLIKGEAFRINAKVALASLSLRPDILAKAVVRKSVGDKVALAPLVKLNLGTAKTGIPPYNTKTIRAQELEGTEMFVMMNAATVSRKGLADGDLVTLDSGRRKIPARVRVFEGVMNDTVAVCLGFGHTALDAFSQNKGANVMELMNASPEPETGLTVWSQAGVVIVKA